MNFKIRPFQLAIILYLSRSYTILTNSTYTGSYTATLYAVFISFFIQLLCLLPIYLIYKNNNKTNPLTVANELSPKLGKVTAFLLFLFFFAMCFETLSGFEAFMTNTVYPYADQYIIIIPLVLVVIYSVISGLKPILRTASLIFPFTIIVLIIITGFSLRYANFYLLKPILNHPISEIIKTSLFLTFRNFELIPLIYLLDNVFSGKRKAIFTFLISNTVIHGFRIFSLIVVLGEYAFIQLYASYALASLVEASIFQRLDSLYTIIWVFMAFIRLSFYYWLCLDVLKKIITSKFQPFIIPVTAICLVSITLWKSSFYSLHSEIVVYVTSTCLLVICLLLIPISLLLIQIYNKWRASRC